MPSWDPAQYAKFGDHRLRPALDLIGRIPDTQARRIVDLGCGPGEITEMLAARWPEAERLFAQLGLEPALRRRSARLDDIPTIWRPCGAAPEVVASSSPRGNGIFGHLRTKATGAADGSLDMPAQAGEKIFRRNDANVSGFPQIEHGEALEHVAAQRFDRRVEFRVLLRRRALGVAEQQFAHLLDGRRHGLRRAVRCPVFLVIDTRHGEPHSKNGYSV